MGPPHACRQFLFFQAGEEAVQLAPVGILAIVLSPWVGRNVSRIDPRKLASISFVGFAIVLFMRSLFNVQAPFLTILIPTVLQGAAMAFFFIPLQSIVFSGLTPEQMPGASGMSNFARITAGAFGTSVFTTLWESRAALHHAQLAEAVHPGNAAAMQAIAQLEGSGYSREQALATLNRVLDQQAFTMAVDDLFWLSSMLYLGLLGLVWLARPLPPLPAAAKPSTPPDSGGAH